MTLHLRKVVAALAALSLIASACGDDAESGASTATTTTTTSSASSTSGGAACDGAVDGGSCSMAGTSCPYTGTEECYQTCQLVCDGVGWSLACSADLAICECGNMPTPSCCAEYPQVIACQGLNAGGGGAGGAAAAGGAGGR